MAQKGSKKALSEQHENWVALLYEGTRSPTSGAHVTDAGDVRTKSELFECKYKGSALEPLKSKPGIVKQMEKIADEAWELQREPVLALRFYLPESTLANNNGWIDLSVRLAPDDAERNFQLRRMKRQTCEDDGFR